MEERVELLEGELIKVGESLQLLSHHYNILQHFLQLQFGHKFQEFYEKEVDTDGDGGGGQEEADGSLQQFYDDNEQGTEDEEAYIREFEVGTDEGQGDEDTAGLLNVQVGDNEDAEQDEDDEDIGMSPPAVVVSVGSGSPGPPKLTPQTTRTSGRSSSSSSSQSPRLKYVQNSPVPVTRGRAEGAVSNLRGGNIVNSNNSRPGPPPLMHRPVPSSSSSGSQGAIVMRGGSVPGRNGPGTATGPRQRTRTVISKTAPFVMKPTFRRTTNGALVPVDPKAFQDDLNGGKYGRYYRKVNSELIQCKICNKILKRRGKFVQHLRTHTGEKPFACEYCGATFSRRDNMNVHMQRHHPSDPYHHQGNGNNSSGNTNGDNSSDEAILMTSPELLCYMCYKPLRNQGEYNTHLQQDHGMKIEEDDEEDEEMYNDNNDEGQQEDEDYNEGDQEGDSYWT